MEKRHIPVPPLSRMGDTPGMTIFRPPQHRIRNLHRETDEFELNDTIPLMIDDDDDGLDGPLNFDRVNLSPIEIESSQVRSASAQDDGPWMIAHGLIPTGVLSSYRSSPNLPQNLN